MKLKEPYKNFQPHPSTYSYPVYSPVPFSVLMDNRDSLSHITVNQLCISYVLNSRNPPDRFEL